MKKHIFNLLLVISPFLVNAQANLIVGSGVVFNVGADSFLGAGNINNKGEFNILGRVTTVDLETSGSDTLSVRSNATNTGSLITTGTVTNNGAFKVERFLNSNKIWQLVSSPMTQEKSETFYGHYLNWYDQPNGQFNAISSPTYELNSGEGYVAKRDGNLVGSAPNPVVFDKSNLTTGDYNVTISDTGVGETTFGLPGDFNLLGNPYPSNLDWEDLQNGNIFGFSGGVSSTYYYYVDDPSGSPNGNVSGWKTYTVGDGTPERYISIGQAFGVICTTPGNLVFKNTNRTHEVASFNKKSNTKQYLEIVSKTDTYVDISKIRFNENATNYFDYDLDAYKLNSFAESPNTSFISADNKKMYICEMPETESVDLGFNISVDKEVTFSVNNTDGFAQIVLEDKKQNTFTDLMQQTYTFQYSLDDNELGRFTLHFKKETLSEAEINIALKVYYGSKSINIKSDKTLYNAYVNIYNTSGQIILQKKYSKLDNRSIDANLTRGIYIVEVKSDEGKTTTRINVTNHNN